MADIFNIFASVMSIEKRLLTDRHRGTDWFYCIRLSPLPLTQGGTICFAFAQAMRSIAWQMLSPQVMLKCNQTQDHFRQNRH
jgi:hypothetical protein